MGFSTNPLLVIAGHSRSKNGVASLAYGPGNPSIICEMMDARVKPAHDAVSVSAAGASA
jgi:hypothetical protein